VLGSRCAPARRRICQPVWSTVTILLFPPGRLLPHSLGTCLLLLTFLLPACDGERQRLMTEQYPSYPDSVRRSIDRGNILRGMSEDQVYLALGSPVCKKNVDDEGRSVTVWLYPPIGRDACVTSDFRVYFEQGAVTTWDHFKIPTRYTDPAGGLPAY